MLFNSWQFILFFTAIFFLYFILPYKYRVLLLLTGSYIFYMAWKWEFAALMLAVSAINFYTGKKIRRQHKRKRKYFG
jgi:D-alanyl-lipoteichoic acid acyltransferase DltB (MBOAT superfamily)